MIEISDEEDFSLMRIGSFMKKQPQILTQKLIENENDLSILKNLLIYYSEENYLLREKVLELYKQNSKVITP
jgi:hypothetical protein